MKPLSPANRFSRGFTLVELLVAGAVTALVLTSICGIYLSTAGEWERQQDQVNAMTATSTACAKIADYVSKSNSVYAVDRFGTGDALAFCLPFDQAYSTLYVPAWSGGKLQYRSGNWYVFYLSDSTGSFTVSGNILWIASVNISASPPIVTPDSNWSKYYSTSKGAVQPLSSLSFTVDSSGTRPVVTITATSSYKIKGTTAKVVQKRTACVRNGS